MNLNFDNDADRIKANLELRRKIHHETERALANYRAHLEFMAADIPIEALVISKSILRALKARGISRVFELRNFDLTQIEGLNFATREALASSLEQFMSMLN